MKILYIQVLYKYLMGTYFFSLSLSHAVVCIITSYNSKMYSRDFTVSEAMQQLSNDDTKISTAIKHTCQNTCKALHSTMDSTEFVNDGSWHVRQLKTQQLHIC